MKVLTRTRALRILLATYFSRRSLLHATRVDANVASVVVCHGGTQLINLCLEITDILQAIFHIG